MKKIFFVLIFSIFIISGCSERTTIKVVGYKNISSSLKEEIMYEWYEEEPNKMIKTTYTYTYSNASRGTYDEQLIECDNYKRKGTMYKCSVEKSSGNVIVKKSISKDEEMTMEQAKDKLSQNGYILE